MSGKTMEKPPPNFKPTKPKSRLLAMKSKLRSRQKPPSTPGKDQGPDSEELSASREELTTPEPDVQDTGVLSSNENQRPRTIESCPTEQLSQAARNNKKLKKGRRSKTLEVKFSGIDKHIPEKEYNNNVSEFERTKFSSKSFGFRGRKEGFVAAPQGHRIDSSPKISSSLKKNQFSQNQQVNQTDNMTYVSILPGKENRFMGKVPVYNEDNGVSSENGMSHGESRPPSARQKAQFQSRLFFQRSSSLDDTGRSSERLTSSTKGNLNTAPGDKSMPFQRSLDNMGPRAMAYQSARSLDYDRVNRRYDVPPSNETTQTRGTILPPRSKLVPPSSSTLPPRSTGVAKTNGAVPSKTGIKPVSNRMIPSKSGTMPLSKMSTPSRGLSNSSSSPMKNGNVPKRSIIMPQKSLIVPPGNGLNKPQTKSSTLPLITKTPADQEPRKISSSQYVLLNKNRPTHYLLDPDDDFFSNSFRDRLFSRSLDDLSSLKVSADLSKLSAESDPSSNSTEHLNDRERYLKEWAVTKPKALLKMKADSHEVDKPVSVPKQESNENSSEKSGKRSFFRKDRKSKALQRSKTLDSNKLLFGEKKNKFHGSDPNIYEVRSPEVEGSELYRVNIRHKSPLADAGNNFSGEDRKQRLRNDIPDYIIEHGPPKQGEGYPKQGDSYPKQGEGHPKQGEGHPKQGDGQQMVDQEETGVVNNHHGSQEINSQTHQSRFIAAKLNSKRQEKSKLLDAGGRSKSNLCVTNPDDIKYQRRPQGDATDAGIDRMTARRHTVTVTGNEHSLTNGVTMPCESTNQRGVFIEHLAQRYPSHADIIRSTTNWDHADVDRRHTTQINQRLPHHPDPRQHHPQAGPQHPPQGRPPDARGPPLPRGGPGQENGRGGLSESDLSPQGSFNRGNRLRTSMPVVRSPNKSLDRPMGLIFLTFRNETKRALLPNEITSLDTVKALFVRSFCEFLSMSWFDIPGHKLYILDKNTNVFYELDDIRDVKDRAVLKIYETGPQGPPPSPGPNSPRAPDYLTLHCHHAGYESDSSARSAPAGPGVRSPLHHPPLSPRLYGTQGASKTQTLPVHAQSTYACPAQVKAAYGTVTYSSDQHGAAHPHWSPTTLRAQQTGPPGPSNGGPYLHPSHSNQSSPQRAHPTHQAIRPEQRHSVAYIPDPNAIYQDARMPQSRSYHDYHDGGSNHTSGSATPTLPDGAAKARMDQMEAQLANLTAWVQTTVMKTSQGDGSRPGSARSNSSVVSDGSYSAKSKSDSSNTPLYSPASSIKQGMSDVSSSTPQPVISVDMQKSLRTLHHHARDLRSEVNKLRRLQVTNMESMRETIQETSKQLRSVICGVPGVLDQPLRTERYKVAVGAKEYKDDTDRVQQDLADLEASVEELRSDVLNRKCRINMTEVENMALALSTITKALGDLKTSFPVLQEDMKAVMQGEMKVVVEEEKFLRDEPDRIDNGLKRCKKITGTLATMRRLAMVQEHKTPTIPSLQTASPKEENRMAVLDDIKAMIPNHEARATGVQAAEDSRERKKRLDAKSESLRFEKSLAMAQKQLKDPSTKERALNGLKPVQEDQTQQQNISGSSQSSESKTASYTDTSLEKLQSDVSQETGKLTGPPPQKPPRLSQDQGVVFGSNGEVGIKVQEDIQNFRLSTFDSTSSVGSVPGVDSPRSGVSNILHKPPSPSSTSTPKTASHVTFSPAITEISMNSSTDSTPGLSSKDTKPSSAAFQEGKKKVPPPPPPRLSSRINLKSPSPTRPNQPSLTSPSSESPHMYENIEKLNIVPGKKSGSPEKGGPNLQKTKLQRPKSAIDVKAPTNGQKTRSLSLTSPTKSRPLNKFQQDLAAGIYSNMNRPDLQDQRVNPAQVVHDTSMSPHSPDPPSSHSSSSSLDSQLGGTIKRNKAYTGKKDDDYPDSKQVSKPSGQSSPQDQDPGTDKRKIPPPPPQRKASSLTQEQEKESEKKLSGDITPPGVSRLQAQYDRIKVQQKEQVQKQLINGGTPTISGKMPGPPTAPKSRNVISNGETNKKGPVDPKDPKSFEETDIY